MSKSKNSGFKDYTTHNFGHYFAVVVWSNVEGCIVFSKSLFNQNNNHEWSRNEDYLIICKIVIAFRYLKSSVEKHFYVPKQLYVPVCPWKIFIIFDIAFSYYLTTYKPLSKAERFITSPAQNELDLLL